MQTVSHRTQHFALLMDLLSVSQVDLTLSGFHHSNSHNSLKWFCNHAGGCIQIDNSTAGFSTSRQDSATDWSCGSLAVTVDTSHAVWYSTEGAISGAPVLEANVTFNSHNVVWLIVAALLRLGLSWDSWLLETTVIQNPHPMCSLARHIQSRSLNFWCIRHKLQLQSIYFRFLCLLWIHLAFQD